MKWPWQRVRASDIARGTAHGLLNSITYKPGVSLGWKFVHDDPTSSREVLVLTLDAAVLNADKPGETTTLHAQRMIPFKITPDELIGEVYMMLREFELHELGEWFKVDGVKIYDPHRGEMT